MIYMRRFIILCIALPLAWTEAATAQAAHRVLCYHARPKPGCSAFILTNFGTYLVLGRATSGDTPLRALVDWGFMANVSDKDAVGASMFFSADRDGFGIGPALRYRRWLGDAKSVELAVGAPLASAGADNYAMTIGSVFGLVKWSPTHWFGVAARPELIREPVFLGCSPTYCPGDAIQARMRLSIGAEIGWIPGAVMTPLALAAMWFAAIVSSID